MKRSIQSLDLLTTTTPRRPFAQSHLGIRSYFLGHTLKINALADIYSEVAEAPHVRKPVVAWNQNLPSQLMTFLTRRI